MNHILFFFCFISVSLIAISKGQIISSGVSCAEKQIIVNHHNDLRKKVANGEVNRQPKASNMQKIVWDDKLEQIAQIWANRMVFKHNKNAKDARFSVGENLYIQYSTSNDKTFDWKQAINEWFDEYKKYTFKPTVMDAATGHYTQVAWADTMYVGCGACHYNGNNGMKNKLYVCNYGPAGNFLGQYPYSTGAGCENLCCKNQCGKLYGNKC